MASPSSLDEFLARPLVCHVATSGPTVRPVWFLWEEGCFWVLSGSWSSLPGRIGSDPALALVVDTSDLVTGETIQVISSGTAEVVPFGIERGARMLARYLGSDQRRWDPRFVRYLTDDRSVVWVKIRPERIKFTDLSYSPPSACS